MADHPDITPDELARAAEVFQATGSYTEAARAIGRSRVGTMQALRRASDGNVRQRVYARTLDAVLTEGVSLQRKAMRTLKRDAKSGDPKVAHSAIATLNDTVRAAATARTAHAKLTGEHAADRHEHKVVTAMTDDELLAEAQRLAASAADTDDAGSTR